MKNGRRSRFGVLSLVLGFLAMLIFVAPTIAAAEQWTGNVNFSLGQKYLSSSDWASVDDQTSVGAEVTWGKKDWPIQIATDLLGSTQEKTSSGVKVEGNTSELGLGIRKVWDIEKVHPYLGGGVAFISGEGKVSSSGLSAKDNDSSAGEWVGGGIYWRLGNRFNLGADARYSRAKVNFFGTDVEAGGTQAGVTFGWGWPAAR